jgi:hypothetical protein
MHALKVCVFATSLSLGLMSSYCVHRMIDEVNARVSEGERISIFRDKMAILVMHRQIHPKSRLRLAALLCVLTSFLLFIYSADAVL